MVPFCGSRGCGLRGALREIAKHKLGSLSALEQAVATALGALTANQAKAYFRHSGYDLQQL